MLVYILTTIKYNIYGVSSFTEGAKAYKYKNNEITKIFQNIFSSDNGSKVSNIGSYLPPDAGSSDRMTDGLCSRLKLPPEAFKPQSTPVLLSC